MLRTALARATTPNMILLAGWFIFVIYAYPGYMTWDPIWQLEQARHLEPYNDWHPPMMAVLWHLTDSVVAGPFPMLILQSTAFLLGCYGVLRHVMAPRPAAALAALTLLLPQNIIVLGVIWKDSQMAAYLMAGLALLLAEQRRHRGVGYFFIFLATAMRYNAAAATLPIVVLTFALHRSMAWWKRYALGLAVWLGLTVLAVVVSALMIEKRTHVWESGSAPVELAGIVRFTPGLSDAELLADTPGVHWLPTKNIRSFVRRKYSPSSSFLDVTLYDRKVIEEPKTEADFAALAAAWKTLVRKHPMAFLRHRVAVFKVQLAARTGGRGHVWSGFVHDGWVAPILEHQAHHSPIQEWMVDEVTRWDGAFGVPVWVYFVVALLLLPLCRRHRLPFILLSSALLYELGLFPVAPAIDYRYSHWMVAATGLAIIVLFVERLRGRSGVVCAGDLR